MPANTLLIFCSCPDREVAERISAHLVDEKLAACVSLTPPVTSIYNWQGRQERTEETVLMIKSTRQRYSELEQRILTLHPYELPEIIAVPVEQGLAGYLNWVEQCTKNQD